MMMMMMMVDLMDGFAGDDTATPRPH